MPLYWYFIMMTVDVLTNKTLNSLKHNTQYKTKYKIYKHTHKHSHGIFKTIIRTNIFFLFSLDVFRTQYRDRCAGAQIAS